MIASTVDQYNAFAADVRATVHDKGRAWYATTSHHSIRHGSSLNPVKTGLGHSFV